MQARTQSVKLAIGALALFALGTATATKAGPPKIIVAIFSEEDAQFAETITLYADGKYQQAETVKKTSLYGPKPLRGLSFPDGISEAFLAPKRSGTWQALDKENEQPVVFKTLAALPKDAMIVVKGAMPFGVTWEHQSPYPSHGDRTLPASSFQAALPAPAKK